MTDDEKWNGSRHENCHEIRKVLSSLNTVAPRYNELRYNEDPVITKNILKPGRIRVKYVETNPVITNPAITKSPL